ncbi:MAG: ethanolamine utilization protein EutH [Cloacibacillus evryensis]
MVVPAEEGGSVPLEDGLLICGQIATVLIGAFPMVKWITRTFGGALETVGRHLGMNEDAAAGMVANLANNIAMFNIFEKMDPKGKLLNVAFCLRGLRLRRPPRFTAGANPEMIFPVVVRKLVAGITASHPRELPRADAAR